MVHLSPFESFHVLVDSTWPRRRYTGLSGPTSPSIELFTECLRSGSFRGMNADSCTRREIDRNDLRYQAHLVLKARDLSRRTETVHHLFCF
jgi:hypothetical protein